MLLVPFVLGACLSQSKIQTRYTAEQAECQGFAEDNIDRYTAGKRLSQKDRNAELVTLFSDCMGKRGWQVAKPKRAKTAGYVPGSGTDQAPLPTAKQPVPGAQPVQTQPSALAPSPDQPALNPPVSNNVPAGAATYQPARDLPMGGSPYGTGPGRQF